MNKQERIEYARDLFKALGRTLNELEEIEVNATTEKKEEIYLVEHFTRGLEDLIEYYDNERSELDDEIATLTNCTDAENGIMQYEKE